MEQIQMGSLSKVRQLQIKHSVASELFDFMDRQRVNNLEVAEEHRHRAETYKDTETGELDADSLEDEAEARARVESYNDIAIALDKAY